MNPPPHDPAPRREPIFNAPPATLWTCGLLIVAFVAFQLLPFHWQSAAVRLLAFSPGLFLALLETGAPDLVALAFLPLPGHALLHGDTMHLVLNTGFLLAFGSVVERRVGTLGFIALFLGAAAGGALAELFTGPRNVYMIGASGAVYGMMGGFVALLLRHGVSGQGRRLLEFVAVILLINLLTGVAGIGDLLAGAEVAWRAHIGGFVTGFLLAGVLFRRPKGRRAGPGGQ